MAGEGSVYQRSDRKWVAQLSLGSREDRTYVRRVRATKREAVAAVRELQADRLLGNEPSKLSLGAYLRWWLDETAAQAVSPNTLRGYEDAVAHFEPIAHIPLVDLRADHIETVCNRMRATRYMGKIRPPVDIGPASPKTVRNAQLMLRGALEQAFVRGHVRRNEAKLVPLRRVPRKRKPAMTPELARAILVAIDGDRYAAAYALGMAALREGEILGLARSDVDLERGVVTLRHQLVGSGRHARLAHLKTEASEETVDLPDFVLDRLRAHIAADKRSVVDLAGGLVFVTPLGYGVNGSWLTKHFQALIKRAGLPRMTVHDLRSGAASLLAAGGAHPSMARDFLRHATVTTTLRDYTRTTPGQRRETAALLDRVVRGVTR